MKRDRALELLGLPDQVKAFTLEEITAAYKRACFAGHPDTGAEGVGADMTELQQARTFLILNLNGQNNACPQCKGRAYIQAKVGMRPCGACKGTGDKQW